jgi:hypothetical protein
MLSKNKWELKEIFKDEDYEIKDLKTLNNINKDEVFYQESKLILKYIEEGYNVINKQFPMSLEKMENYNGFSNEKN